MGSRYVPPSPIDGEDQSKCRGNITTFACRLLTNSTICSIRPPISIKKLVRQRWACSCLQAAAETLLAKQSTSDSRTIWGSCQHECRHRASSPASETPPLKTLDYGSKDVCTSKDIPQSTNLTVWPG